MRIARFIPVAFLAAFAWAGCNAIFGITAGTSGGGAGGSDACPPEKAQSCEPEYVDDGSNCCMAGRDCGDGECVDQECTAALLVDGDGNQCVSIEVAGDRLIWTRGGDYGLSSSDTDGSGKATYVYPPELTSTGTARLAIDTSVSPAVAYFTDYFGTAVARTPVDEQRIELFADVPMGVTGQTRFGNILIHGDFVYWAMQVEGTDPGSGKDIWRAKKQLMGAAPVTAEKVIANNHPLALAADDTYLNFDDSEKATIERIPWTALAEGAMLPATSETLATQAAEYVGAEIGEIAVDDTYIYWGSGTHVYAMPKSAPDGERKLVGTTQATVGVILADGRDIYYSTLGYGGPSELYRAPKGGQGAYPKKLYDTESNDLHIYSIAQDCGHIYVLIDESCNVFKLTK